jgi:hypothetical protein
MATLLAPRYFACWRSDSVLSGTTRLLLSLKIVALVSRLRC